MSTSINFVVSKKYQCTFDQQLVLSQNYFFFKKRSFCTRPQVPTLLRCISRTCIHSLFERAMVTNQNITPDLNYQPFRGLSGHLCSICQCHDGSMSRSQYVHKQVPLTSVSPGSGTASSVALKAVSGGRKTLSEVLTIRPHSDAL